MIKPPLPPAPLVKSRYSVDPSAVKERAAQSIPGIVSVRTRDLFPELPRTLPLLKNPKMVRRLTRKALTNVDMSMIKPGHSVNILGSHTGFVAGGDAYAEMLRTIKDTVEERTGCRAIRLRIGGGLRYKEPDEVIKRFHLDGYFGSRPMARGVAATDEGIPIETDIGTLYGLKRVYDADWIIHTHTSYAREVYFHRMLDRALKPFAMSYARLETRACYHLDLGPRIQNMLSRAIFQSRFVQEKWAFACFLLTSPTGIIGIEAGNDLYRLNSLVTLTSIKTYGPLLRLLGEIDECIAVIDSPGSLPYTSADGIIFANLCTANIDLLSLDDPFPPYSWYTESFYDSGGHPLSGEIPPLNKAVKMVVINHCWAGYPSTFFAQHIPTIVIGREQAELIRRDPMNPYFMDYASVMDDLRSAVRHSVEKSGTDKIMIFDGAAGGINASRPLAELLVKRAVKVREYVRDILMRKWLSQRGMEEAYYV